MLFVCATGDVFCCLFVPLGVCFVVCLCHWGCGLLFVCATGDVLCCLFVPLGTCFVVCLCHWGCVLLFVCSTCNVFDSDLPFLNVYILQEDNETARVQSVRMLTPGAGILLFKVSLCGARFLTMCCC